MNKKIANTLLIILILGIFAVDIYAFVNNNMVDGTASNTVSRLVGNIWAAVSTVIYVLAVCSVMFAGLRYMMSSTREKANIKKQTGILLVGGIFVFTATFIINIVSVIVSEIGPQVIAETPKDKVQVEIPEIYEKLTYNKEDVSDGKYDISSVPIEFESGTEPLSGTVEIRNGEIYNYTFVYEDKYVTSKAGKTEIKEIVKEPIEQIKSTETLLFNVKDYGAKGDGITDDTLAIKKAVDNLNKKGGTLYFPKGTYRVSILPDEFKAIGRLNANGEIYPNVDSSQVGVIRLTNSNVDYIIDFGGSTLKLNTNSYPVYNIVCAVGCKNVEIKNGTLVGDATTHIYKYIQSDQYSTDDGAEYRACKAWLNSNAARDYYNNDGINYIDYFIGVKRLTSQYATHEFGYGIYLGGVRDAKITSMEIKYMTGDGIVVNGISGFSDSNTIIDNCDLSYCRRQGITICDTNNTIVKNTKIRKIGTNEKIIGTLPMFGIDIEPDLRTFMAKEVVVSNCEIVENAGGAIIDVYKRAKNVKVTNSILQNTVGIHKDVGKIENCNIILTNYMEIKNTLVENSRYYLGNTGNLVIMENNILRNCTFNKANVITGTNMLVAFIGGGELTNCKFYGLRGADGTNVSQLNSTWGILFAMDGTGNRQATGELKQSGNYYENCDMWLTLYKDSKGFGINDSEFNSCYIRCYQPDGVDVYMRDTTIRNSTIWEYDKPTVKWYNCNWSACNWYCNNTNNYINGAYKNDK